MRRKKIKFQDTVDHLACRICGEMRESLAAHIIHIHGIKTAEYREMFGVQYLIAPKARERLSKCRVSKRRYRKGYKPRTKEQIIADIKKLAKNKPILSQDIRRKDYSLYRQMIYQFGCWSDFCKLTGIRNIGRLNHDDLTSYIRKRKKEKKSLYSPEVGKENPEMICYAEGVYGSWPKALIAHGITPPKRTFKKDKFGKFTK